MNVHFNFRGSKTVLSNYIPVMGHFFKVKPREQFQICSTQSQSNKVVLYLLNLANNNLQDYVPMSVSKFAWSIVAEKVILKACNDN